MVCSHKKHPLSREENVSSLHRRSFICSAAATVALPAASILKGTPVYASQQSNNSLVADQVEREQVWAFFRSFYSDKDNANLPGFLSHFAQSSQDKYQDAVLNLTLTGFDEIASTFTSVLNTVGGKLGKGQFSKIFRATGDTRYGAIAEYVDLKNTFYGTNGITIQTVFDLDGGLIVRDTDYWDSRELGESDIVGPADTTDVAVPLGAVHPGGVPLSGPPPVPPGNVQLTMGVTGRPSASDEMIAFAKEFHDALGHGSIHEIADFFTEDALYVNPLMHQGPVNYGNFDQGIQIRGLSLIVALLKATLDALPDCRRSSLVHIVGGRAGGGFEWKAGGIYANTGIDRTGLVGCTALDLFRGRIQRMSVKFDTFQMSTTQYEDIRTALADSGIVDQ
jgi:hypothetical protein